MTLEDLFIDLVKVSLGNYRELPQSPSDKEWNELFRLAQQQSLIGICFSGIETLSQEQRPNKHLLLNWYASVSQIEERNKTLNKYAVELCEQLHNVGFETCILKGQGVAMYYHNPLRRQSGDIDVWLRTANGTWQEDRNKTIAFVRKSLPDAKARYHHIDYDVNKDIPVELHFMPTYMHSPFENRKLQQWFEDEKKVQFGNRNGELTVPTDEFNIIYLLLHIQKHIIEEGIGLRQLMDYYYLLINGNYGNKTALFERFGILNTARAVMYVLQEAFGLDNKHLLCEPDEKLGKFLIDEVMLAGNFGKYDPRYGDLSNESTLHVFCRKQKRGLRFMRMNSQEILWSPYFAVYQRIWRYRRDLI